MTSGERRKGFTKEEREWGRHRKERVHNGLEHTRRWLGFDPAPQGPPSNTNNNQRQREKEKGESKQVHVPRAPFRQFK